MVQDNSQNAPKKDFLNFFFLFLLLSSSCVPAFLIRLIPAVLPS